MGTTTDPSDPRLGHGVDTEPRGQNPVYLVLSEEERAKGLVRPVRRTYRHIGRRPAHPLRDLTPEESKTYDGLGYVAFEIYPESELPATGRFWTEADLRSGCGERTTMAQDLAETYARDPEFYGATYCCYCQKHLPVAEFVWVDDGTVVGS